MIEKTSTIKDYQIVALTPNLVEKYANDICESLDQILGVDPHTKDKLLQEKNADRIFHKKWSHSFILLDGESFVGIIIGYEREAEGNSQYPYNSIYLSDFAISKNYQKRGIGRSFVEIWLDRNRAIGFLKLSGRLRFSVQTNKENWNKHVQELYESFGFKKISQKAYGNRIDNVYFLEI